jgi:hypothetical protein
MKPLKKKTKIILAVAAIALVGIGYFIKPLFGRNGKSEIVPILSAATQSGFKCEWAGFVKSRKTGLFQIFVACDVSSALEDTTIKNQDEMSRAIEDRFIAKIASEVPNEKNLSVAFISRVDQNVVLCTDVREKQIKRSWYDSYDNYCMP